MLTLTLDGFLVDLPDGAEVALSYRVFDLNNFETREAGFSESFVLPLTNRNLQVLGVPHAYDSDTTSPYRLLPAVLRYNDVLILQGHALLEQAADGYDITLTTSAGALFAAVGDKPLRGLDLSDYDHFFSLSAVQLAQANTPTAAYTYPLVDDGRLTKRYPTPSTAVVHYSELSPAVFSRMLLERIVADALPGYTLTGSLLAEDRFQRHQLLGGEVGPRRREEYLKFHTLEAKSTAAQTISSTGTTTVLTLAFPEAVKDEGLHLYPKMGGGSFYRLPAEVADYRVQLVFDVTYQGTGGSYAGTQKVGLLVAENNLNFHDEPIFEGQWNSGITPQTRRIKIDTTFSRVSGSGEIIVQLTTENRMQASIAAGARLVVTPLARAYDNSPVHLDASLPDISRGEFLKLLANQFGVLFQTDQEQRLIRADLLADVNRNLAAGRVQDWSSKVDRTLRPRQKFRLDSIGQKNYFRYEEAPGAYELLDKPDYQGEGMLPYSLDTTIAEGKEAYVAPFAALQDGPALRRASTLPYVPRFTQAQGSNFELWRPNTTYPLDYFVLDRGRYWQSKDTLGSINARPGTNPAYWRVAKESELFQGEGDAPYFSVLYLDQPAIPNVRVGNGNNDAGFTPTAGVTFLGLDFGEDLLPAYFLTLGRVLRRVHIVEVDVHLNAADIAQLDFTLPVRLNIPHWPGYGALIGDYYLNLIDQYTPGQTAPVPCTLVSLNTTNIPAAEVSIPTTGDQYVRITENDQAMLLENNEYRFNEDNH
ncbi:hypothetical protein [Hymenobacter fodinae]|uniref:Uncharacterized protein n=1 Tax=Hymenobacter fodinae TaxID=2510796 RepID=A0A4Z0PBA5_9BACT|nr:hypothetical protein [Hymenobacter fodinae]TGE08757.1 hypothetical protein EU556_13810 [Hymenobacter fodinae]